MVKVGSVSAGEDEEALVTPTGTSGHSSTNSSSNSLASSTAEGGEGKSKSKSRRKSATLNVRLRAWGQDDTDNPYTAEQFRPLDTPIPVKSIALAVFLFVVGSLLLLFGVLLFMGIIQGTNDKDERWMPMMIIGSLMFIPGSYHTYLAVQAWRRAPGYSYNDIPSYED